MATALITGASSGIGREFAHVFAEKMHNLVLVSIDEDGLEGVGKEIREKYNVTVDLILADLRDPREVGRVYAECSSQRFVVDILVNDAGMGEFGPFVEMDWEKIQRIIDLNIKAVTKLCHLFIPGMVARKSGHILNIASTAAFQPGPLMAVYYATKSYVLFLSEALYNELEGTGVHITCLCPGPTSTHFFSIAHMEQSNLVKGRNLPTPRKVAELGYKSMMKNKMTVIHGLGNFILANCVRFVPRRWVLPIVRHVQKKI